MVLPKLFSSFIASTSSFFSPFFVNTYKVLIAFKAMERLLGITKNSDSLTLQSNCKILCYHKNNTNQIQIARISNMANWYFERVVFPGEQLFFEALPEAELEIYTGTTVHAILADKILCSRLQVQD
jgi:hypothetical protein